MNGSNVSPIRSERGTGEPQLLPLSRIIERTENTRPLNPVHVRALMQNIAHVGLIEPIVVDCAGRLLAGHHRLAAIKDLQAKAPKDFERHFEHGVPVQQMGFDAQGEVDKALAVEVAENEFRRDYSETDLMRLVIRLRNAGYKDTAGRPKSSEKALGPALQLIAHKSARTVTRLLATLDGRAENHEDAHERRVREALESLLGSAVDVKVKAGPRGTTVTLKMSEADTVADFVAKLQGPKAM